MTSYNLVNSQETSEMYDLITQILRGEWGFNGFIVTDWGNDSAHFKEQLAGNDVKMASGNTSNLTQAYNGGVLSRGVLEASVEHVLNVIMRTSKFKEVIENPYIFGDMKKPVALRKNDDEITAEFTVSNKSTTETEVINALCIMAGYDADGRLKVYASGTIQVGASRSVSGVLPLQCEDDLTFKAFIWDANTFAPLYPAYTHDGTWYSANLALNTTARSTDAQAGYPAIAVVDGNRTSTRWSASATGAPRWIEVDLGAVYELDTLEIFFQGEATTIIVGTGHRYRVWGRTSEITDWDQPYPTNKDFASDGNYTLIADQSSRSDRNNYSTDSLKGRFARYVVIQVTSFSGTITSGARASIYSIEISGYQ